MSLRDATRPQPAARKDVPTASRKRGSSRAAPGELVPVPRLVRLARARILKSIDHLSLGHFGNTKSVGGGVGELRVDYGPGYRIYFVRRGARLILLAYGGDKSRQKTDIARAREIAARWEPEHGD